MLLQPDCISCILAMSISLIRKLPLDEKQIKELYTKILTFPELRGLKWDVTSPEVIEGVMKKITDTLGDPDPYRAEKTALNTTLMERYDFFKEIVESDPDPLYTAVKLAIFGNAIDFMVPGGTADVETVVRKQLETHLPHEDFSIFKEKLEAVKTVLYLGDNAGEIVMDRLLIETILKRCDLELTYVVRSVPTLNDATMNEAVEVGMDKVTRVIENGIDGPLPGTILHRCSDEVKELFDRADLIVSKGGGNYDSLGEETEYLDKITFMLLSKCYPYNRNFGKEHFQPIIASGAATIQ